MKKFLFVALLLPAFALAAESPFTGTWKVDLAKAQFSQKPEVWLLQDGRYQCSTCVAKIDIKADGTDQPTPGSPGGDMMAVNVVNDRMVEITTKRGGRVTGAAKCTVSADGNTLTMEFTSYPEGSKQPVTGTQIMTRAAAGPSGSHAFSGSWRTAKVAAVSDNALTSTFKGSADGLMMSSPTGESYDAKFDGKDYPVKGGADASTVSLKRLNERSVEETIKRGGKIIYVNTMAVSADGRTMTVKSEDKERGTTDSWVAVKQ
jgi:hypothetical protein